MNLNSEMQPRFIAHRGLSARAPENTLPAFKQAADGSFWGIETDVRLTRDGRMVCMHDASVDRTTGGTGKVAGLDAGAIRRLDAGTWYGPQYAGTKVPFFAEYLEVCAERKQHAYVELKGVFSTVKLREVLNLIDQSTGQANTTIISFTYDLLGAVRELAPGIRLGLCTKDPGTETTESVRTLGNAFLDVRHTALTRAKVDRALRSGLEVECWTVNDPGRAREMAGWGVRGITTDGPGWYCAGS